MLALLPRRETTSTVTSTPFERVSDAAAAVVPRLRSYFSQPLTGSHVQVMQKRPSPFWHGAADYDTLVAAAQFMLADLRSNPVSGLISIEVDRLVKFVQWRRLPVGWQVIPGGLLEDRAVATGTHATRLWQNIIDETWAHEVRMAAWTARDIRNAATSHLRIYADRAKGAPFHFPSRLDWSEARWHIMAARGLMTGHLTGAQLLKTSIAACPWMQSDWYAISFVRLQGTSKPSTIYALGGGALQPQMDVQYEFPKVRTIWSVPLWLNCVLRPSLGIVASLIKRSPYHTVDAAVIRSRVSSWARAGLTLWSEDASGFDQSVPGAAIAAFMHSDLRIQRAINMPGSYLAALDHAYGVINSMGILGPRVAPGEAARTWRRDGRGIISGLSLTTGIGTWIRLGSIVYVYSRVQGISLAHAWADLAAGRWGAIVYGDDAIIGLPKGTDPLNWQAHMAELGFTTKLEPGATFLMRWYGDGYTAGQTAPHGFVANMFGNSVNRETQNEARTETIAALGIAARLTATSSSPYANLLDQAYMRGTEPMIHSYRRAKTQGLPALAAAVQAELEAMPAPGRRRELELLIPLLSSAGGVPSALATLDDETSASTTTDITAPEYAYDAKVFIALTNKLSLRAQTERAR